MDTHRHLELYTNNYQFSPTYIDITKFGTQRVFVVSNLKGNERRKKPKLKSFNGRLNRNARGVSNKGDDKSVTQS